MTKTPTLRVSADMLVWSTPTFNASRMEGDHAAPPVACLCAPNDSSIAIGASLVATLVIAVFALHPRIVWCRRTLLRLVPTTADRRAGSPRVAGRRAPAPRSPSDSPRQQQSRQGAARGEETTVRRERNRYAERRTTSATTAGRRPRPAGSDRRAPAQEKAAVRRERDRYAERRTTSAAPAGLRAGSPVAGRRAPAAPRPRQQSCEEGAQGGHAAVRRELISQLARRPRFSRSAPRSQEAAESLLPRHWTFSLSRSHPNMRISSGSLFYANVVQRQIAAWQQARESEDSPDSRF